jgi:glutathione S-transferase
MRLYFTPTSPFVRKVLIAAHETGTIARIETQLLRPTPEAPDAELSKTNPLSKIPALILDDGTGLYDSRVIIEYLDSLHQGEHLIPTAGPERFFALKMQALADGMLDAGVLLFYEKDKRPREKIWEEWIAGQKRKIEQGLDALEREASRFRPERPDVGQIAGAAALGWFVFRKIVDAPFQRRPRLQDWHAAFSQRPSMVKTQPVA